MTVSFAGLRALLIQKDVKHVSCPRHIHWGLRALLIQKDVKLFVKQTQHLLSFESFVNSERCKTRVI